MNIEFSELLKELSEAAIKDIQTHIIEQRNIDGTSYDPLKYRSGKRNIISGNFMNNAFTYKINGNNSAFIGYKPDYLKIAWVLEKYSSILGFSQEFSTESEKIISKFIDKFLNSSI